MHVEIKLAHMCTQLQGMCPPIQLYLSVDTHTLIYVIYIHDYMYIHYILFNLVYR